MLSELGAKLTFNGMNTKLDLTNVLGLPLSVTLDVCHLIKLVRNTLGDFKLLKNGRNEAMSWEYFENLHSLQETKGLHLANNLHKKTHQLATFFSSIRSSNGCNNNPTTTQVQFILLYTLFGPLQLTSFFLSKMPNLIVPRFLHLLNNELGF